MLQLLHHPVLKPVCSSVVLLFIKEAVLGLYCDGASGWIIQAGSEGLIAGNVAKAGNPAK
jgi:hypothetical protein